MRLYVDGTLITPHGVRRGPECVGQSDGRVSRLSLARISFPVLKVGIASVRPEAEKDWGR